MLLKKNTYLKIIKRENYFETNAIYPNIYSQSLQPAIPF